MEYAQFVSPAEVQHQLIVTILAAYIINIRRQRRSKVLSMNDASMKYKADLSKVQNYWRHAAIWPSEQKFLERLHHHATGEAAPVYVLY